MASLLIVLTRELSWLFGGGFIPSSTPPVLPSPTEGTDVSFVLCGPPFYAGQGAG
jgi:hypothetical protein